MVLYDVVVVGSGPSGSIAAYETARFGLKTLLLEKSSHPRDKPCGGAVMYRGLRVIKHVPRKIVQRKIFGLRFVLPDGRDIAFKTSKLIGITTNRDEFDAYLAHRAEEMGVYLLERARVKQVSIYDDYVCCTLADGREFRSRFLIGADGVNTVVGHSTGLRGKKNLRRVGLGMESDFIVGEDIVDLIFNGDPSILEIRPVKNRMSYGWVFPKRDSLAIGVAGTAIQMRPLRHIFDLFVYSIERTFNITLTPKRRGTSFLGADGVVNRNVTDRVILVGDAAGFVDPLMGEGIAYAMRSGFHAASVIVEAIECGRHDASFLSRYEKICRNEFAANFMVAEWAGTRGTAFAEAVLTHASNLSVSPEVLAMLSRGELGYSDLPAFVLRKIPREIPSLIRNMVLRRFQESEYTKHI